MYTYNSSNPQEQITQIIRNSPDKRIFETAMSLDPIFSTQYSNYDKNGSASRSKTLTDDNQDYYSSRRAAQSKSREKYMNEFKISDPSRESLHKITKRVSTYNKKNYVDVSTIRQECHIEEKVCPELDFSIDISGVKITNSFSFRCKSSRIIGARSKNIFSILTIFHI